MLEPLDAKDPRRRRATSGRTEIDTAISEAKRNGIKVALTVTGTPELGEARAALRRDLRRLPHRRGQALPGRAPVGDRDDPAKSLSARATTPRLLDGAYAALKAASKRNRSSAATRQQRAASWIQAAKASARMDFYGTRPDRPARRRRSRR